MSEKKLAIPSENGMLSKHFGHCRQFELIDIRDGEVAHRQAVDPPPHQPGLLPKWLHEKGVTDLIAGGIGQKAIHLFQSFGIKVCYGIEMGPVDSIIDRFLKNDLEQGQNLCDH